MKNQGTKTLETDRLILRRFCSSDAEAMFRNWASDPLVTTYLTWPAHKDASLTASIMESWIKKYEDPAYYNWAIEWKEAGEVIGDISVVALHEEVEAADIGYCLGRAWWGQGIMPEALRAVIDYLFAEVGLNRIAANHDNNNPKSGRVMEKAGMKQEGILRMAGKNNQGICDEVWHSILREEWTCL